MRKLHKILTCALALLLLAGCGAAEPEPVRGAFFAMDTAMALTLYGTRDGDGPENVLRDAEALVRELERELSVTDPDSALYAVNRDGGGTLPPEASALLDSALGLCGRTGGALDVTIYPVLRAWGFTTGAYDVPPREELDALLEHVGYERVGHDAPSGTVTLEEGMMLDLGAVAKGYAADGLRELVLRRLGEDTHALLDLGGNIVAIGTKPGGSPWRVAIRDPSGDGYAGVLEAADQCVVTSGGYERWFERDGVRYWHILDPATGEPARSGLQSVTVVGDAGSCTECDAFSTALFVMGTDRAVEFWRENEDLPLDLILIGDDGSLYITERLENAFTPAEAYAGAVTVLRR